MKNTTQLLLSPARSEMIIIKVGFGEESKRKELNHIDDDVLCMRCNCQTDLYAKRIVPLRERESEDLRTHKTLGTRNQAILCVCVLEQHS